MAISYLGISFNTRSKGHKAVAGAAYRSGGKLYDEKYDITHDFEHRGDVKYSNILLPDEANDQFQDRQFLWNRVESSEKRKDSQVAIDYILALPRELTLDQQIELANSFAQYHFVSKGLVVDVSIHNKEDGNPHAHLYTSTRRLQGDQFDRLKARDLMPKIRNGFLIPEEEHIWNKKYRDFQENYFKEKGILLHVDPNHIIPQRHEGRVNEQHEDHYKKQENQIRHELSVDIALNDPRNLLNILGDQSSVFNEQTIAKTIKRYIDSPEAFQQAMVNVLSHEDCIGLGIGADGRETYTTRANYLREAKMADHADALSKRQGHAISSTVVDYVKHTSTLSDEQKIALSHLTTGSDVAVLVGRAGTGKSYLMKSAREVWEQQGFRVSGIAVSGIAAKSLFDETGIPSSTLFSFKQRYLHSKQPEDQLLSSQDVLVLDEAGMVSVNDMATLVSMVENAGAKLVLVGDPDQLQPIGSGAPLRALAAHVGHVSMENIRRQTDIGDRAASLALSQRQTATAIDHYASRQAIHLIDDGDGVRESSYAALIQDWFSSWDTKNPHSQLILAHRNQDVQLLNEKARNKLIHEGLLEKEHVTVSAIRQEKTISLALTKGDRLLFLQNNSALDVKNGELASVMSISEDMITVRRDRDQRTFTFSTKDYQQFDYGYAATVHKTQGVTLDRAFVYAGGAGWNRHLAYVALTRHRERVALYGSQQDYSSLDDLKLAFSRDEFRDNVLDFPLSYAERRGFDTDSLVDRFIHRTMNIKNMIKDAWLFVANYEAYLLRKIDKVRELSREDRRLAKQTAAYIDAVRELNRDSSTLRDELGKEMYKDARYADLMQRQIDLNRDAFALWENKAAFGRDTSLPDVLARNRYTMASFEKAVMAHKNRLVMDRYLTAYEQKKGSLRRSQAHAMEKASDSFAYFSYACQQRGLSVRDVQQQLRQDIQAVNRTTFSQSLTAEQNQYLNTVERYLSAQAEIKALWRDIYARDAEPSDNEQRKIRGFSALRDRLAMQITSNTEVYREALSFYGINLDSLIQQSDAHSRRSMVKSLDLLVSRADRGEIASHVLADRTNYRYVYEQGGDWKEIHQLAREYGHTLFLRELSKDERLSYDLVSQYQRARFDAARAWATYFDVKARKGAHADNVLKIARVYHQKRNELAYALMVNQTSTARFLEKTNLSIADIQKQAKQHHEQLHQWRKKYLDKDSQLTPHVTTASSKPSLNEHTTYDVDTVNQALSAMGEDFYNTVLGMEGKRSGHQIRYGKKGSLSVQLHGSHAGSWHSFETDEGGYPLQLLMNSTHGWGLSFKEALEEGAHLAGLSPNIRVANEKNRELLAQQRKRDQENKVLSDQEKNKTEQKIAAARYYWNSAKPIEGTLAEVYLRQVRGLSGDLSSFRYHDRIKDPDTKQYYPGIVVCARNKENEITAVQTILLNKDGRKANKDNGLNVIKRSRGVVKGSAVLIHPGKQEGQQQVVIAEGPETAASLITSLPDAHIYITLGNISNAKELHWLAEKHHTQQLLFAADNDGAYGKTMGKIRDVAQKLYSQHGILSYLTKSYLPGKSPSDKVDFNDVLLKKGGSGVKRQVNHVSKISVRSLDILLDEQSLNTGFNDLLDEWRRIAQHYHPAFKGLADSHQRWTNDQHPEALRMSAQQTYQKHLEKILSTPALRKDFEKIAPSTYQKISQSHQPMAEPSIDWLSPAYDKEWKALEESSHPRIKKWAEDRYTFKTSDHDVLKKNKLTSLHRSIERLIKDKPCFAEIREKAPLLSQQMQQYHAYQKNRDQDRSR